MALDPQRDGDPVADVDHAGILARSDEHTAAPRVGSRPRWTRDDLYEQCSLHMTAYIASSTVVGARPRTATIMSSSSSVRPELAVRRPAAASHSQCRSDHRHRYRLSLRSSKLGLPDGYLSYLHCTLHDRSSAIVVLMATPRKALRDDDRAQGGARRRPCPGSRRPPLPRGARAQPPPPWAPAEHRLAAASSSTRSRPRLRDADP